MACSGGSCAIGGDAAEAAAILVSRGERGEWDIGRDDDRRPLEEVARLACAAAGADEALIEVTDPPPGPASALESLDTERLRSLGWRPTVELEDGLRRTVDRLDGDQLRFDLPETVALFQDAYHIPLEADVAVGLEGRTEGGAGLLSPAPTRPEGRAGPGPALRPRPVDDLDLDLLDRHRVGVDAEHAGALARRRAEPAGELREVVGRVQPR